MEFCYDVEECNNISVHMFLTQFSGFIFEVEKDDKNTKIRVSLKTSKNAMYVNDTQYVELTIDNDAFKYDISETVYTIIDSLKKGKWSTQDKVNNYLDKYLN